MNLEELTFKQVCNCLGLIKKLVVENIINFDLDTGIATLNYDNVTKYLENQNLEQQEEIERLNNIINELEKWVKEDKECFETQFYMGRCVNFQCILDKLKELKGDSSNE